MDGAPNSNRNEGLLTVDEVAAALRMNRKTVYDAIARKEIPVVRVGRLIRVPGAWLQPAAGNAEAA
jgi:excisionase family DNA binding protein